MINACCVYKAMSWMLRLNKHFSFKSRQVLKTHEPVYQAIWVDNIDFDEVLISPAMIQDHMPDTVLAALNKVSVILDDHLFAASFFFLFFFSLFFFFSKYPFILLINKNYSIHTIKCNAMCKCLFVSNKFLYSFLCFLFLFELT